MVVHKDTRHMFLNQKSSQKKPKSEHEKRSG